MLLGMSDVVLARSLRRDNAPSVASRWVQRMTTVAGPEATQAMRQPGSTIKPFVYATGLDNGMTPSTQVDNTRYCYYQGRNLGEKCIRGGRAGRVQRLAGMAGSQ